MRRNVIYLLMSAALALPIMMPAFMFTGAQSAYADSAKVAPATNYDAELDTQILAIKTAQGNFEFTVEIADEPHERQKGLMFRETMPTKHGMLFDFGETRQIQMWMRNTPLSLDMIFLTPDGKVVRIAERTTPFSDAIIDSTVPISHVLELNAGVSKLIGLKIGDFIELP